ncbi:5'-nucleotidase (lipoprotein e(P4) family) [Thermoflavifilum aggregans]|uniref:5'-nucleotidase (Lipoprotein e(P4) family) n=2 Tax=Thermoflavifilum aggregans TaxID=454188 RepID=A0A2M9CX40_9BACT|nr:5'-nucleotidase (lipoprotein e(P4) family) [Thermoflavifilum aggregans]
MQIAGLVLLGWISSCSSSRQAQHNAHQTSVNTALVYATLWHQRAAEYKALCLQAYQVARHQLDAYLDTANRYARYAVITDIDETLLSNARYEATMALQGKTFDPQSWNAWVMKAEADTIPGALDFFRYAASRGIQVFYISNRTADQLNATIQNLRRYGFPDADQVHVLLSPNGSEDKSDRRAAVEKDYRVILLLGDNLGDFSHVFDHQPMAVRDSLVYVRAGLFGTRWIVIPNDMYGEWQRAYVNYQHLSPARQDSVYQALLKGE